MKRILLSAVFCCAVSTGVMAEAPVPVSPIQSIVVQQGSEVSGEGQALLDLFKKDVLPAELTLSAEPTIVPDGTGYVVTVPQSTLADEQKTVVPEYRVVFNRTDDFNGYPAFEADVKDVSYLSPMLSRLMAQNDMTLQQFSYKIGFVPALNISVGQGMTVDGVVMKNEGKDVLVINKILEKASVTPLPGQMAKIERATGVSQFFLNTPLGSVRMDRLTSLFEIPSIPLNTMSLENVWNVKEARMSSDISNLQITSMLLPVQEISTNVALNTTLKQTTDAGRMDMALNLSLKDIAVAQSVDGLTDKIPTYVTMRILLPNLDTRQVRRVIELNQEIADEATSAERQKAAQQELDEAMSRLMEQTVVEIKEAAFGSDQYAVTVNGVLSQKDETFKGTLNIVNFDFISPEGTVDEKACLEARQKADALMEQMAQAQDDSLFDQALSAQMTVSDLCEPQSGLLDALRPYLATAKRSVNARGQTVDQFDVLFNQTGLYLNGTLVMSQESDEKGAEQTQTETVVETVEPTAPLIP